MWLYCVKVTGKTEEHNSYSTSFFLLLNASIYFLNCTKMYHQIAQWLERRTRDWKVAGPNPCRSGGRIFFSRVDFLCWLLFRYPFHPRAVARKRSRSFCQKCRWEVTAKHTYTLPMWLWMKWHCARNFTESVGIQNDSAGSNLSTHELSVSTFPLRPLWSSCWTL